LEYGSGKGEHLDFVSDDFSEYINLDLFETPSSYPGKGDPRISWKKGDMGELSGYDNYFDRVISMCVLHHVQFPEKVIRNSIRVLKPGGTFSLFLPSDPGLANRVNRKLFVTPKVKKLGFTDYELVNAREHHNHYWALRTELLYQVQKCDVHVKYYPLNVRMANLSLFSIWQITKNF
jgi:ubiquinone/menaquinone biosynthesis C-methylase UbiE